MSARPKIALAVTLALLFGAVAYELRLTARQRAELSALNARRTALAEQLEKIRRQTADDAAALSALEEQSNRARTENADSSDSRTASETHAWLAKLATVRRLFAEHPERGIPELQLLELRDWLGVVKGLSFDTDEQTRKSLAAVRDAAKRQFTMQLSFALRKYLNARDGELPPNLFALAPYFSPPMNTTILDRYTMVRTGRLDSNVSSTDPVVLEKSPVDEAFDHRHGVNVGRMADGSGWGVVQGSFGGIGPAAWIDK